MQGAALSPRVVTDATRPSASSTSHRTVPRRIQQPAIAGLPGDDNLTTLMQRRELLAGAQSRFRYHRAFRKPTSQAAGAPCSPLLSRRPPTGSRTDAFETARAATRPAQTSPPAALCEGALAGGPDLRPRTTSPVAPTQL